MLFGRRNDEPARAGRDRHYPRRRLDPIQYPRALWDDQLRAWVSNTEVAEIPYTAFISKKGQAITARLIVRRIKDLNHQAAAGQDELFDVWRHHAVFTDSPFVTLQAEAQHRDQAIIEHACQRRRMGVHGQRIRPDGRTPARLETRTGARYLSCTCPGSLKFLQAWAGARGRRPRA